MKKMNKMDKSVTFITNEFTYFSYNEIKKIGQNDRFFLINFTNFDWAVLAINFEL